MAGPVDVGLAEEVVVVVAGTTGGVEVDVLVDVEVDVDVEVEVEVDVEETMTPCL